MTEKVRKRKTLMIRLRSCTLTGGWGKLPWFNMVVYCEKAAQHGSVQCGARSTWSTVKFNMVDKEFFNDNLFKNVIFWTNYNVMK